MWFIGFLNSRWHHLGVEFDNLERTLQIVCFGDRPWFYKGWCVYCQTTMQQFLVRRWSETLICLSLAKVPSYVLAIYITYRKQCNMFTIGKVTLFSRKQCFGMIPSLCLAFDSIDRWFLICPGRSVFRTANGAEFMSW